MLCSYVGFPTFCNEEKAIRTNKLQPPCCDQLRLARPSSKKNLALGYNSAATIVQVLKQAGDDLSRENIMRQTTNLRDLELPMLLPGIKVSTSPTDCYPVQQLQLMRFDGKRWVRFGDLVYDE
jgi:hypothetical protein